jgi:RHS repeat-associated protein
MATTLRLCSGQARGARRSQRPAAGPPAPRIGALSPHRWTRVAELRYKAWGETRYTDGTTPTTYRFTGQREDATIGLYFYNARYYDPALGRFVSADTVVPEPGNPSHGDSLRSQALNRYRTLTTTPHGIPMQRGMASTGRRTSG